MPSATGSPWAQPSRSARTGRRPRHAAPASAGRRPAGSGSGSSRSAFGSSDDVERLAAVRGGEGLAAADRGEVAPDELDLGAERRLRPACRAPGRIAQRPRDTERIQRQRPGGRRHRSGRERMPGRGGPRAVTQDAVADAAGTLGRDGVRRQVAVGLGLADPDRHGRSVDRRVNAASARGSTLSGALSAS